MSEELVRNFLLARGVDSDAADYAASLACVDDDDYDPEALREFVAEACPDATSDALDDLFASIERSSGSGGGDRGGGRGSSGSSPPRPPPPDDTSSSAAKDQQHLQVSPSALLRALELRSTKVEELEQLEEDEVGGAGRRRRKNTNDGDDDDDDDSCSGGDEDEASALAVNSLLELFPARGRDYLAHALRINGGDASEAAAWLSGAATGDAAAAADDNGDNGESAWRAAREERRRRRRAERAADEAARARLLEKFDATAVVTSGELGGGAGGGGRGGAPVRLWGEAGGKKGGGSSSKQPQQQRFRDGVAVTSKGEKYITIKEGEEWDGGSRGRVVLKGKRGAGGVKLAK